MDGWVVGLSDGRAALCKCTSERNNPCQAVSSSLGIAGPLGLGNCRPPTEPRPSIRPNTVHTHLFRGICMVVGLKFQEQVHAVNSCVRIPGPKQTQTDLRQPCTYQKGKVLGPPFQRE